MPFDLPSLRETYARDGVVLLPRALDETALAAALAAWEWSVAHPGPGASRIPSPAAEATFYQDLFNPRCLEGYAAMLRASPLPAMIADIWGAPDVWFMYEQVFLKEGGDVGRTPWHQDGSYIPMDGEDNATAWISFEPLAKADSLEFVRGSHLGTVYNTSKFDPKDETLPHDESLPYPNLPRIEAEREKFDIISWPVAPGDVIFFHFRTLHGGAPTRPGQRRRTLTLRFFGERTHYDPKTAKALPNFPDMATKLKPGDTMRAPGFLQLHPKTAALAPAGAL